MQSWLPPREPNPMAGTRQGLSCVWGGGSVSYHPRHCLKTQSRPLCTHYGHPCRVQLPPPWGLPFQFRPQDPSRGFEATAGELARGRSSLPLSREPLDWSPPHSCISGPGSWGAATPCNRPAPPCSTVHPSPFFARMFPGRCRDGLLLVKNPRESAEGAVGGSRICYTALHREVRVGTPLGARTRKTVPSNRPPAVQERPAWAGACPSPPPPPSSCWARGRRWRRGRAPPRGRLDVPTDPAPPSP